MRSRSQPRASTLYRTYVIYAKGRKISAKKMLGSRTKGQAPQSTEVRFGRSSWAARRVQPGRLWPEGKTATATVCNLNLINFSQVEREFKETVLENVVSGHG